jgi:enoyl-CoA hydratase/carnithine racemase
MEAILGSDDFGAELAERYGWINRALPDAELDAFVARRFRQLVVSDAAQGRTAALFAQGLQTRDPLELDLGDRLGTL